MSKEVAFGALMPNPPAWLANEMAYLNGQISPKDLRCLSIFPDDPTLPPQPGFLQEIWHRLSGTAPARGKALRKEVTAFFHLQSNDRFPCAGAAQSSGSEIYTPPLRRTDKPQRALIVHAQLAAKTPNPDTHDPGCSSASGDSLQRAAFLYLVGHALNPENMPPEQKVPAADTFALTTLLDRGEAQLAQHYVAVRTLESFRSMRPLGFNTLAMRELIGLPNGKIGPEQETSALCEILYRLTHPGAVKSAPERIDTDVGQLERKLRFDNGLNNPPPGKLAFAAQLARLDTLRHESPLSPAAHLMANILIESGKEMGVVAPPPARRPTLVTAVRL